MLNKKQYRYLASGQARAEVTHLWGKSNRHYISLKKWCDQANELVMADFTMGPNTDALRDKYYRYQEFAYTYADGFGSVHIEKEG